MNNLKLIENGLIRVYITDIGEYVVDGRELWQGLQSKQDFSTWVKKRLADCEAVENEDYYLLHKKMEQVSGAKHLIDYIIKLDIAKEMAMLERNDIGKQYRRYFIEVEKKYRKGEVAKVESDATKEKLAEAKLKNAKVREANILLKIAEKVDIPTYQQIMYSKATEVLFDEMILPLPKAERQTYSATEIGERLGISANKVGKIANANNLKTAEYGERVWDKSQHSNRQVETWRYYENVLPVLEKFLRTKECDGSGV